MDPRLKTPSNILVVGPSKSGKTTFVCRMIRERNEMFRDPLPRVLFCYTEWQSVFDALKKVEGVTMHEGLPKDFYSPFDGKPGMLVMDDLMVEGAGDPELEKLITRGSHHRQLTTVCLSQNLFRKGMRTQNLNTHYVVAFKNPRDRTQMGYLFRQAFPKHQKAAEEAFKEATQDRYGYLLFDFETDTPDELRLRTRIFPSDKGPQIVYEPKEV